MFLTSSTLNKHTKWVAFAREASNLETNVVIIMWRESILSLFIFFPEKARATIWYSGGLKKEEGKNEGRRNEKKLNERWPKLFSEIRRFFRASSEMIFARINP